MKNSFKLYLIGKLNSKSKVKKNNIISKTTNKFFSHYVSDAEIVSIKAFYPIYVHHLVKPLLSSNPS